MDEKISLLSNDLGNYARIYVDKAMYSNIAILKVCYEMSKNNHMHISNRDESYVIDIYSKDKCLHSVCHKFMDNLIDQELRQHIIKETTAVRELIIGKAFYEVAQKNCVDWNGIDIKKSDTDYMKDEFGILTIRG